MTRWINLVSQESERSENAVMNHAVGIADLLCRNFPIGEVGGLKQKISMWVQVEINNWVRP
jgi:hypothetical protein